MYNLCLYLANFNVYEYNEVYKCLFQMVVILEYAKLRRDYDETNTLAISSKSW